MQKRKGSSLTPAPGTAKSNAEGMILGPGVLDEPKQATAVAVPAV
jgi:hypothetical protein